MCVSVGIRDGVHICVFTVLCFHTRVSRVVLTTEPELAAHGGCPHPVCGVFVLKRLQLEETCSQFYLPAGLFPTEDSCQ